MFVSITSMWQCLLPLQAFGKFLLLLLLNHFSRVQLCATP